MSSLWACLCRLLPCVMRVTRMLDRAYILPKLGIFPKVGKIIFAYVIEVICFLVWLGRWEDFCAIGLMRARARVRMRVRVELFAKTFPITDIFPSAKIILYLEALSFSRRVLDLP